MNLYSQSLYKWISGISGVFRINYNTVKISEIPSKIINEEINLIIFGQTFHSHSYVLRFRIIFGLPTDMSVE